MESAKTPGRHEARLVQQWEGLRKWARDCGYYYTELARLSGLHRMTFYNLHKEGYTPDFRTLRGIARARDQIEKMEAAEKEKVE